jgi:hypothetical protein
MDGTAPLPATTIGPVHALPVVCDRIPRRRLMRCMMAAILLLTASPPLHAQTPDPSDIRAGGELFRKKADCQACHGWAADGRKMNNEMPDGADLRTTKLDRDTLITTIKCGRPGTGMPAFDKFAYSDGRCYGLKQADLKARGLQIADPSSPLIPREVENIVDFLYAKVIGKGPINRAGCIEYWGSDIDLCKDLPN